MSLLLQQQGAPAAPRAHNRHPHRNVPLRACLLLLATLLRLGLPAAPLVKALFHGRGCGVHRAMVKGGNKGARKLPPMPKVPRSLPVARHGLRPARCPCCARKPRRLKAVG